MRLFEYAPPPRIEDICARAARWAMLANVHFRRYVGMCDDTRAPATADMGDDPMDVDGADDEGWRAAIGPIVLEPLVVDGALMRVVRQWHEQRALNARVRAAAGDVVEEGGGGDAGVQ